MEREQRSPPGFTSSQSNEDAARALPIGIFDSGLGGLTVVRAVAQHLPNESLLYLGDSARLPYGSKSPETVLRYSRMSVNFLAARGVKLLLIACNTASAFALSTLRGELAIPILGAIEPGVEAALAATQRKRIGVIGTLGTIRSQAYRRALHAREPGIEVVELACPLLVPLVEEGWLGDGSDPREDRAATIIVERYLAGLQKLAPELDVLVLGCTHYPLLAPLIARVANDLWHHEVKLVDSAQSMAQAAETALRAIGLLAETTPVANADRHDRIRCFVTDDARLSDVGSRFLGQPLNSVEKIDL